VEAAVPSRSTDLRSGLTLALVAGILLAGCGGSVPASGEVRTLAPTPPGAPTDSTAPAVTPSQAVTPLQAAQADLDNLLVQLEMIHPEPFHGIDREAWIAHLHALRDGLGDLTPEQALVELQRVVALLSRDGRDGHQLALQAPGHTGPMLPLRIYEFDDGVFITAAMAPGQADLVGTRIQAVNGHPIDEVLAALDPLVPRDGPATVPFFRPLHLLRTEVLRGLGLIGVGDVTLSVAAPGGAPREVVVSPVPFEEHLAWAGDLGVIRLAERPGLDYVADLDTIFSWRVMDGGRTLSLRYTQLRPIDAADLRAVRDRVAAGGIERVILDLRQNPGGDNNNIGPLLTFLKDPSIDREGRLFVLTDHSTFSAASNLSTQIEQGTSAIFAGQAMAGGLNFWNDVRFVRLPNYPIPMQVGVSTRYWRFAPPDDPRLTIEPEIAVPLLAADYFGDRDAVLEAVLDRPLP
jgi:hypothetical protein